MSVGRRFSFILAVITAVVLAEPAAQAAVQGKLVPPNGNAIVLELNEGELLRLSQPVDSVFVANPAVADVSVKSSKLIYVFGRTPGETSLYAVDAQENVIANVKLVVRHNVSRLQETLDSVLPKGGVSAVSIDGGIVLTGTVGSAMAAENARRIATRFLGENEELISQIAVAAPNQVNLRVRIAEVSKEVINQLSFNWDLQYAGEFTFGLFTNNPVDLANSIFGSGTAGDFSVDALLDMLAEDNLVSILAEPNLTAVSGETASFLAGGEFPIPVNQDEDTITVEFKEFGVSLAFTPTILSEERISMRVRPEVSQISNALSVDLQFFTIPSLTTRRAETTVELASGQSFAIAGLILDNTRQEASKIPGLGDIPILGALFRSDRFERNETELVIIVTPYIVAPVSTDRLRSPTEPFQAQTSSAQTAGSGNVATVRQTIPLQNAGAGDSKSPSRAGFIID